MFKTHRPLSSLALAAVLLLAAGCSEKWPPEVVDPEDSPVLSPEEGLESLVVPPGFRVELVAAEPLVQDAVAMDFDADGRIYVAEMRGWMTDIDGGGALDPIGQIAVLEDTDGDGVMDARTVFLDSLVSPNSVKALSDGVLVGEPNNLWFARDVDGDFKADEKELVSDDFGIRKANMESNANGLVWGMDNWIHTTENEARYRRVDGEWVEQPTLVVGQFGLTMDDFGRMYRNNNSQPVYADYVESHYYARNPNMPRSSGVEEAIADDRQVWPIRVTRGANRGYQENILREDGTLRTFTAACGLSVYRGGGFPDEFTERVNIFVPEPVANLVHRYVIEENEDGTRTAKHGYEEASFLTSTDERFRPVNSMTGPDGALYVVDMYRGIIEHRDFQTTYLRQRIEEAELDEPVGLGRIYRVVHEDAPAARPPSLSEASSEELVEYLRHDNGWWRDTAQRLLVEGSHTDAVSRLREMASTDDDVRTRLHALWTLEGLGAMDPELVRQALQDSSSHVRVAAVQLSEPFLQDGSSDLLEALAAHVDDASPAVRLHLAAALGEAEYEAAAPLQLALLERHAEQPYLVEAVLSGLHGREFAFLERAMQDDGWYESGPGYDRVVATFSSAIIESDNPSDINRLIAHAASEEAPKWQRLAVLEGVEDQFPSSRGVVLPLELPARPASLDRLAEAEDHEVREKVQTIAERLTWPGKPGSQDRYDVLAPKVKEHYEQGRAIYEAQCAVCHGPNGEGEEDVGVALVGSEWVNGGHYNLVRILLQGKEGEIGLMPPQRNLSDEEIAQVLTYVRNAWGNAAYPVTPGQAADLRVETAAREMPWTDAELRATVH